MVVKREARGGHAAGCGCRAGLGWLQVIRFLLFFLGDRRDGTGVEGFRLPLITLILDGIDCMAKDRLDEMQSHSNRCA
jgi:hypothetical protein